MCFLIKLFFWLWIMMCGSTILASERILLSLSDSEVLSLSEYVLSELRKLSDSGIYDTLKLDKILSYERTDGIFHINTSLKLQLTSKHWKSSQIFEFIVMDHKDDNIRSFAIDEFPVMSQDDIEKSWMKKVEKKKVIREKTFRRLEIEGLSFQDYNQTITVLTFRLSKTNILIVCCSLLLGEHPSFVDENYTKLKEKLDQQSTVDILDELENSVLQKYRYNNSQKLQKQLNHPVILKEEKMLSEYSLRQLYEITIHEDETDMAINNSNSNTNSQHKTIYSDYMKTRAKELLDVSIAYLQKQIGE